MPSVSAFLSLVCALLMAHVYVRLFSSGLIQNKEQVDRRRMKFECRQKEREVIAGVSQQVAALRRR